MTGNLTNLSLRNWPFRFWWLITWFFSVSTKSSCSCLLVNLCNIFVGFYQSIVTPTYLSSYGCKRGGDNLLSTVKAEQKNIFAKAASSFSASLFIFGFFWKSRNAPDFDWQISHTCGIHWRLVVKKNKPFCGIYQWFMHHYSRKTKFWLNYK